MKHSYLLLLLLLALPGRGQNFCPFRPGQLVEFTRVGGNDTTVAVQLDRRGTTAAVGDSVYNFNTELLAQRSPCTTCSHYNGGSNRLVGSVGLRNQQTMRPTYSLNGWTPNTLGGPVAFWPVSIPLNPRALIGQSWTTDAGTARVTARRLGLVLGQPDSLVDIELYDGVRRLSISLSKTYGLVRIYPMAEIINNANNATVPTAYALTALPQLGLGAAATGARAVYDFQVGDVFLYHYTANNPMGPTPFSRIDYYYGDSVLARTNSTTSDAVTYQMYSRSWRTGNRVVSTYSVTYSSATSLPYSRPTGRMYLDRSSGRRLQFLPAVAAGISRRAVQKLVAFARCGADSSCVAAPLTDVGYRISFGVGLGLVSRQTENLFPNYTSLLLEAYRKGTQLVGSLAPWYLGALPTRATRPATTTAAFPQPFDESLTVTFALVRPQPVALTLRDALGRAVLLRPAAPLPAGNQQLVLDTHHLPAGLYTLHLALEGEGRTEVLKVLKNNE